MNKKFNPQDADLIDRLLAISPSDRGIGERLLSDWGSLGDLAQNIDAAKLTIRQRSVLGAALAIRFVREERPSISSPADIAALVSDLGFEQKEHLVILVLDTRNNLLCRENLYIGSVNSSQVRVAECFRQAIIRNSAAIVIVHNHPSGDPTPSPDDVALTRALVQAGKLLDIQVLDHLVIGSNGKYSSLKERGLGFS